MNPILREDFDLVHRSLGAKLLPLKGKSILISGANGMLAGYMTRFLSYLHLKHDFQLDISGIVREEKNSLPGVKYIVGDVTSVKLHQKYDYIVHAASLASPVHYGSNPIGVSLPNVEGTIHLLRHAEAFPVKSFLFISSSEAYGDFGKDKEAIEENEFGKLDPMNPRSCYAESKRMGENLCASWKIQHNIPVKVVRPFHSYGPGISRTDGRIFGDLIYSVVEKKNIVLNSRGEAKRAFCYQSDALMGMLLILLEGKNGEAYNLGNPEQEFSIREAAEIAAGLHPDRKIKVEINESEGNSGYIKSQVLRACPSIAKISELGWKPKTNLKEGLLRTISYIEGDQ